MELENLQLGIEHPEDISGIYLYRYRDPWISKYINPELVRYRIRRETPQGYWVYNHDTNKEKWISKNGFIRYAYIHKKDALYSYYRRKIAHIKIINEKFDQLRGIIRIIEKEGSIKTFPHLNLSDIGKHNNEIFFQWKVKRKNEFIEEGEMIV